MPVRKPSRPPRPPERSRVLQDDPVAPRMEKRLQEEGFYLPPKPEWERPQLPKDPSELGRFDLIALMAQFTGWADFVAGELAVAEVAHRDLESRMVKLESVMLLSVMPSGEDLRRREDSMTRARAEVRADSKVQDLRSQEMEAYARKKLLAPIFESLIRDEGVLSRELTRRGDGLRSARTERSTP